ncbi:hypothetical protein G6F50_016717 [Rhizopus delemar]|uniref:Uncharacterized protein n=1 Tax=Rhizopus delemar TaxID=936053 RepID=A0A9P7C1L5_9FUNG|nr:hypothetical protein G6F50_016717 [Rhizopus delemar]
MKPMKLATDRPMMPNATGLPKPSTGPCGPHLRIARFLHRGVGQDQGDHRQAAMHQENPFPARQREDGAAHDRPEAQADAEDEAPP